LAGNAEISWVEAYAPSDADPEAVHGPWPDARAEVAGLAARAVSEAELDDWHRWWRAGLADTAPEQLAAGSGAGAAELAVRGQDPDSLPGTPFGQPAADGFRHLVALVRTGEVDEGAAGTEVLVPPTGDRWGPVFERPGGWWGELMRAIRAHARGELGGGAARLPALRPAPVYPVGGPGSGPARRRRG
jgi:hypothetical protein